MEKLKEREKEINCGGRASELVTELIQISCCEDHSLLFAFLLILFFLYAIALLIIILLLYANCKAFLKCSIN